MLKWILKKLGYVHHSELDHHHCNCCNLRSSWHLVSKYYDEAIMKRVEDSLIYGESMRKISNAAGSKIVWNRLDPKKVYKKGAKRGKSKKASSK